MKLTGHKTREAFSRYNITSANDLRDAARKLDAAKLLAGKVSGKVAADLGKIRADRLHVTS